MKTLVMLWLVMGVPGWVLASIEDVGKRLDEIVIREFKVEGVTITSAVDQLRELSKKNDKSVLPSMLR